MNKLFRLFFAVILLGGCIFYVYSNREALNALRMVPMSISLIALVLCVGAIVSHLYANLLILKVYVPTLGFLEFTSLTVTGTIVNFLVPLGAISTKAVYLKTMKTMLYRDFILSHGLAGAIRLAAYGCCLLATLGFIGLSGSYGGVSLWLASCLIAICGFCLSAFLLGVFKLPFRVPWVQRYYEGSLPKMAGLAKPVFIFTSLGATLNFLCAGFVFSSLVMQSKAFVSGGFVGLAGGVLVVLPVTPGNLGSFQAIGGVVSHLLNYDPVAGILASLFLTALRYAGIIIIGIIAFFVCNMSNQIPGSRFTSE